MVGRPRVGGGAQVAREVGELVEGGVDADEGEVGLDDEQVELPDVLPGQVLSGVGTGFMLPTLTGAGAAALPPARFATGVAVVATGGQIGRRSASPCLSQF